ncbi:MAG TPA: PQQ-dependent sugar dehydrogenase [Thermodesulfobacteriota bacterium]|nr:PQQ-dependent sugar dehydrogenase [Thermodesulfobacteriota bacterium]
MTTVKVASGFTEPLYLTAPAGDSSRLFIVEQSTATIKIIKNGVVLGTPFLNINPKVSDSGGERGLLGLAFHPNYASNGYFYVNYIDNSGNTVIARYKVSSNPDVADPASELIVMTVTQPFSNHNGGMLAFSPNDDDLYIGLGDGGDAFDPGNRAQDGQVPLGKILRVDVGNGDKFAAPSTNPFKNNPSYLDTIWALGLRNPWRFSFDRLNGDLYIADVGQGSREEISYQPGTSQGGENYGWRCMEGKQCTGLSGCTCNSPELTLPIYDYTHSGGNCSVTGGYVYRGEAIPDLDGTYFFADFCTGKIWSFMRSGSTVAQFKDRTAELKPITGQTINNITSFGEDDDGEIYIVDRDGEIFKIVDKSTVPQPTPVPTPVPPVPTPAPTAPPTSPTLSPFDPGTANTRNTLTVTGAGNRSRVSFYYSTTSGKMSITSGVCRGKALDLRGPSLIGTVTADTAGKATINATLSRTLGGKKIYLQAKIENASTCKITNRVVQTIKASSGSSSGGHPRPGRSR